MSANVPAPTSAQIRQSFLEFFKEKQHTIVPSDNVGYTSRDGARIFTNAGMNQFVPIFLGERHADVDTWPGVLSKGLPTRAADTQKCIRAGGKHNDLEDVGLDTYHHTFFEMLGNWSFGDYFKKEAIDWAWELVIERWKFPATRVYATIYQPDKAKGDPAERDEEAWGYWAEKFRSVGLDPEIHIVNGNKKDNFWMMADTGPCGPCTEIHVDLTPGPIELDVDRQKAGALLVNGSDASCIEIWNNVFIEFNANADGTFSKLPAQHVDTGMGFERVTSIIQGTKNFTDFENAKISNYDTDVFKPIFDELSRMSGKTYQSTLPKAGSTGETEQEKIDVAFRVIADHIRTLSFAIADGIQPGSSDRNYTLRRILRRAVKYGRTLGFTEPFFYKLVDVLVKHMGEVFPEIRVKQEQVKAVLKMEEESFNRTLDKGMVLFEEEVYPRALFQAFTEIGMQMTRPGKNTMMSKEDWDMFAISKKQGPIEKWTGEDFRNGAWRKYEVSPSVSGEDAFKMYDTYGFPLDLTELLARERGLKVDTKGFEGFMTKQREMAKAAIKKNVVSLSEIETKEPTKFVGYDLMETSAKVLEVVSVNDKTAVVLDASTAYAEMGGQVGDSGEIIVGANTFPVTATSKVGNTWLHFLSGEDVPVVGTEVTFKVDAARRHAIERHHTVTHLLHWALHEVVNKEATQKGSSVTPDKLTFDFNNAALTAGQLADIERLVNERIVANDVVSWSEVPYAEVKSNTGIMQLFGEKYGDKVRVVQIGGAAHALNGYSMELCGGTHTRATGEIGLFRLMGEGAVAAGVRRIEAVAGLPADEAARAGADLLKLLAGKVTAQGSADLEKKIVALLEHQKALEKGLKAAQQREASGRAKELLSGAINGEAIIANLGDVDGDYVMAVAEALKSLFTGAVVLGAAQGGNVVLMATVSKELQGKVQAGKIIQSIAPIVGGKGGGKPDFARGGGKEVAKLDEALVEARRFVGV
ncbi:alanine--tRNA ligase [Phragmitibacter flavus]|uniref:Alanine--tRNA ligase n=1 Tax=Phragmitibacter flavus TaxID=2576071 RepID=A0A5R8K9M3_9BACT|nr:alanine--tRNA ligase [Phragmitibacter flavus]TLD68219.1 alanine--tRNA ligase [Phragmitibacter flavus]